MDKLNQLNLGEKLVAGGGLLLLLSSFFPWWSYSNPLFSVTRDGWSEPGSIWGVLLIITGLALAGLTLALRLGNVQLPSLPASWTLGMIYGAGAGLAILFLLLKAWRIIAVDGGGFGFGFFLGLIATGIIAFGGYTLYTTDKGGGFQALLNKKS